MKVEIHGGKPGRKSFIRMNGGAINELDFSKIMVFELLLMKNTVILHG